MSRSKSKKAAKTPAEKPKRARKVNGKAKDGSDRGRPTVMTPETIRKLEHGFSMGLSDVESCLYAGISTPPLYEYIKLHPEFAARRDELKNNPKMKAKINIWTEIEAGDVRVSQWHLERRDPDYSQKSEVQTTVTLNDAESDLTAEALKRLGGGK